MDSSWARTIRRIIADGKEERFIESAAGENIYRRQSERCKSKLNILKIFSFLDASSTTRLVIFIFF